MAYRLSVVPALVDVGDGALGELRDITVRVRNWTDEPIRIVGGTADCSCVVTRDLPMTVLPSQERPLMVQLLMEGTPGQFTRLVHL